MKPLPPSLRTRAARLALTAALCLGAGLAVAADKKPDEKQDKAPEKKPAATKTGGDPKAAAKDAAPAATNTPPILVVFPKATFITTLEAGRDPFFPASKRRVPKAPEIIKPPIIKPPTNITVVIKPPDAGPTNPPPATVVTNPVPVVPVTLIGSANLSLRGLSGTKARRVAVVHTGERSYDFLKGDTTLIRLPGDRQLKVRCLDIRERSAIFQVEGETETKELFLREGVY